MIFEFITDSSSVSELEVLIMIYNLCLMMSITYVAIQGYKIINSLLRKGAKNFK